MSDKTNPRQILEDLSNELKGSLLEDEFEVHGVKWTMQILSDDELSWSLSKTELDPKNPLAMGISHRTPTLAVGIKKINGTSVADSFQTDWDLLMEDERESLLSVKGQTSNKIGAELLWRYLKAQPPEFIKELWDCWTSLESRKREGQDSLKKSLRGSGEGEEKKSLTEDTPSGE